MIPSLPAGFYECEDVNRSLFTYSVHVLQWIKRKKCFYVMEKKVFVEEKTPPKNSYTHIFRFFFCFCSCYSSSYLLLNPLLYFLNYFYDRSFLSLLFARVSFVNWFFIAHHSGRSSDNIIASTVALNRKILNLCVLACNISYLLEVIEERKSRLVMFFF